MQLPEEEWRKKLSADQYRVLREKGTEAPFSGKYVYKPDRDGVYDCVACGAKLFTTDAQHESTMPGLVGWPSFSDVAKSGTVKLLDDNSGGMSRTEVVCAKCGGHLGHVFDGDPNSLSGKHYCINSCALDFKKKD